jgi:fructokinase
MSKIVCFGEALIDFLSVPPAAPGEAVPFLRNAGGAPANVAVALAALDMQSAFSGMLSEDMFGDFLHESLCAAGVDTRYIARTSRANTALAFVSLDRRGERSFNFYRPPAADLLFTESDFQDECFHGLAAFHACSNSLTEAPIAEATLSGMRRAATAGALVSFDLNLRPALWRRGEDPLPRLWQALALADLVKLSSEELEYLALSEGGADAVRERLWQGRASVLVVTDGPQPLAWHTRSASGKASVPEVRAVDTTGAGDAFVSGLLASLVEQGVKPSSLEAFFHDAAVREPALRFAAACGALAVTRRGAFAAMPRRADLQPYLELAA